MSSYSMEIPLSLTQPWQEERAPEASVPFVYDIESSQDGQGTQLRAATQRDDIEDSDQKPNTLSFATSTPVQVLRRPLILRPVKRAKVEPDTKPDSKFAKDCFAGKFASVVPEPEVSKPSLSSSFVELLRGVCSVFKATHGRDVDFEMVCKSFQ
jgi:hypothetical protein